VNGHQPGNTPDADDENAMPAAAKAAIAKTSHPNRASFDI
jgi:hypothetical protein